MRIKISGKRLKDCREEKGLSQKILAELSKVTKQSISRIENSGDTQAGEELVERLAYVLGCTTDFLQGNVDDPNQVIRDGQVLTRGLIKGGAKERLVSEIRKLPSNRLPALVIIADCLSKYTKQQTDTLAAISQSLLSVKSYNPQSLFSLEDQIALKLQDEYLPLLCEDVYEKNLSQKFKEEQIMADGLEDSINTMMKKYIPVIIENSSENLTSIFKNCMKQAPKLK